MESIFDISSYEAETKQIVADVFHAMLRCDAQPAPEWAGPPTGAVTSVVFFAGTWQGAALLECSRADSLAFAGRLMKIDLEEATDEDASDALGELINMIGGNLKSVLPHGVGLSLPMVVRGEDYCYKVCRGNPRQRFAFQSRVGSLCVTLVQMTPKA